jgi:hypothetical protein
MGPISISGVRMGDAGLLAVFCLLVGGAAGLTYLFKNVLPHVAALAAGFGVFSFFYMLGILLEYPGMIRGAGIWIGLIAALGVGGAFITLALFRPAESSAATTVKLSPLLKRHAALFLSLAGGGGVGFLFLLLSIIAKKGP